jgi:hypothetical protein
VTGPDNDVSPAPAKRKKSEKTGRVNATVAQKIQVLDWYHTTGSRNQSKTAQHFEGKFPGIRIKQPLVSQWVKEEKKIRERYAKNPELADRVKKEAHPKQRRVDQALKAWVDQALVAGMNLTGEVLRNRYRRFATKLKVPEKDWPNLSDGWLTAFKKQNGLKEYKRHGEAASSGVETVEAERERCRKINALYKPEDIENLDETGLFGR